MDVYEKLKTISPKKRMYAIWRFDLEYNKAKPKHTEERLCEILEVKTLSEYIKWENSLEFSQLMNLYLQTKFANDLEEVYASTVEKAKEGDSVSVKLMLQLQKEIRQFNALSNPKKPEESNAFDDLELS